jgi:hypothetical protein
MQAPRVTVNRPGWRTFGRPKVLNAVERGDHGTTAAYRLHNQMRCVWRRFGHL